MRPAATKQNGHPLANDADAREAQRMRIRRMEDDEAQVAAVALCASDLLEPYRDRLSAQDFDQPLWRALAAEALDAIASGGPASPESIMRAVIQAGRFTRADVADAVIAAHEWSINARSNPAAVHRAFESVLNRSFRRAYRDRLNALMARAGDEDATSEQILARMHEAMTALQAKGTCAVESLADGFIDPAERERVMIPTGLSFFDSAMPGGSMALGLMLLLIAPPKVGKSAFALFIVLAALRRNPRLRVLWALGEMDKTRLQLRALCAISGMAPGLLERDDADLTEEQLNRKRAAIEEFHRISPRLKVLDGPLTIAKIYAAAATSGAQIVVVDYLQRVKPARSSDSRRTEVDEVSAGLSEIATRLPATLLVISNMAKAAADGRATIASAAKESSQIGYDCDAAYLAEYPEYVAEALAAGERLPERHELHWRCLGNRNGDPLSIKCVFDRYSQRFHGLAAETGAV